MVYFKDASYSSGEAYLVILDDENQPMEEGVHLSVHTPLVGRKAKRWPSLTNSLSMEDWCQEVHLNKTTKAWSLRAAHHQPLKEPNFLPTLGRNIIDGKAKWIGDDIKFLSEFHYIKGYWEWTEDILSRCKNKLLSARIYDAVYASMYTYDRNSNITKAFFEAWCPTTNTLLTSIGEFSISLWDLYALAGLPMTGLFYDEVIPNATELTGVDEKGHIFLHRSCEYLFRAYHSLLGGSKMNQYSQVSVDQWVRFWSKKRVKYSQTPMRKEKKSTRLASTHNPLGDFCVHKKWSTTEETVFSKLGIRETLKEETYLAAHLACWLCTFVLPGRDVNTIRPSTFKMAAIMASGRQVSLTIPVLASIYKGLNEVSTAVRPTKANPSFPIHFIYAWLAYYFKTHYSVGSELRGPKMVKFSGEGGARYFDPIEARRCIHKGETASWTCLMITTSKDLIFIDDDESGESKANLFISIRSHYLSLRQGDKSIVEPYSPHRFGRQFGYYQEVPGAIKYDVRTVTSDEALRYWRLCTFTKSLSKAMLLSISPNAKKLFSKDYNEWWIKTHGTYLEENISFLSGSKQAPLKGKKHIEEDYMLENITPDPPHPRLPSLAIKCSAPTTKAPEGSKQRSALCNLEESGNSKVDRHWKRQKKDPNLPRLTDADVSSNPSLLNFSKQLHKEILDVDVNEEFQDESNSPDVVPITCNKSREETSKLASVEQRPPFPEASVFVGMKYVLEQQRIHVKSLWRIIRDKITKAKVDDISSLKDEVQVVYDSMKVFKDIDVSHIGGLLQSLFYKAAAYDAARSSSSERLSKELLEQQLGEAKDRLGEARTRESKEVDHIKSTKDELTCVERELKDLKRRKKKLSSSLKCQEELLKSAEINIHSIEDEIVALEKTAPLSDEATKILSTSMTHLASVQKELKNIDILP